MCTGGGGVQDKVTTRLHNQYPDLDSSRYSNTTCSGSWVTHSPTRGGGGEMFLWKLFLVTSLLTLSRFNKTKPINLVLCKVKRPWYQLINRLNLYYIQLMYTETCDRGKARVRAGHGHIGANYCQWQGQERKITILHAILATLILKINLSFERQKMFWLNLCKNLINLFTD